MNVSTRRVMMVAYSYYPWDPRIKREAEALRNEGYTVDIICLRDRGEKIFEKFDHIRVYRLPMRVKRGGTLRYLWQYGLFFLLSFVRVTDLFLHRRHAFIHIHSLPDFEVFAAVVPWLFGSRVILDLHEMMPELFAARFGLPLDSRRIRMAMFLEEASILFADEVLTAVDSYKEAFVSRGATPEKITVVMNSPLPVPVKPEKVERFLRKKGMERTEVVVYTGGLNEERDITGLVKAFNSVHRKRGTVLLLFGHGEASYIRKVRALADDGAVMYCGSIPYDMVNSFLNKSAIGVVTYRRNLLTEKALPTKVFEYAMLGKTMVLPRLPEMERVFHGAALFYEPGNREELELRILEALEAGPGLGERAKERIGPYSWDVMRKRLLSVYDELREELDL